jgi:hypothetical protein
MTLYGKACNKQTATEKGARVYKLQGYDSVIYYISFGEVWNMKTNNTIQNSEFVYFRNKVFQVVDTDCKTFKNGRFAYAI